MPPEQVHGEVLDCRADIFALGAMLYEMLAGRHPFSGTGTRPTLDASLTQQPSDLCTVNPAISPDLSRLALGCLAKSRDDRPARVADVESALESIIQQRNPAAAPTLRALLQQRAVIVTLLLAVIAIVLAGWGWRESVSRARWVRTVVAPEIQRLANRGDYAEAFLLARQALDVLPDDPHVRQLWLDVSIPATMTTNPPGADVAFAAYRAPGAWFS